MQNPFVVLYTTQLQLMVSFYEKLGLTFVEEKHGSGPVHYSTNFCGLTLEIYPDSKKTETSVDRGKHSGAVVLGFTVRSFDKFIDETGLVPHNRNDSLLILLDPDGRRIMVMQEEI